MSKVAIEGNVSGTGTLTIAAPNTNTNRTLTLPDATGTLALAGGGITGTTDSVSPFETSLGTGAGAVTTGVNNTFVGFEAGNDNTSGTSNTAVGFKAFDANTTGGSNTAVGLNALGANTTGSFNAAFGASSLRTNTTGQENTAFGESALRDNTTASNNTAFGAAALLLNTTGENNTAVGKGALAANTTGASNVAMGQTTANTITTGQANTYVGASVSASSASVTFEAVFGSNATGNGGNTFRASPSGGAFQGNNTTVWSTTSDQRLKKNIVDNTEGLEKITGIRVRNFEYRLPEEVTDLPEHSIIQKTGVQLGVIAQELQQVCPDCVIEQSTGVLSVNTDEIFWHMVNAIKELSAQVTALQAEVNSLKGQP